MVTVIFKSTVFPNIQVHGKGNKSFQFKNGEYKTSNEEDIKILKESGFTGELEKTTYTKSIKQPEQKEEQVEEVEEDKVEEDKVEEEVTEDTSLDELVKKYHIGGGYYNIDGQKVRGKDKAIELLSE